MPKDLDLNVSWLLACDHVVWFQFIWKRIYYQRQIVSIPEKVIDHIHTRISFAAV